MFVDLAEFRLMGGNGNSRAVEDNEARTGRALIDGTDKAILEVIFAVCFILEQ